MEAVSVNKDEAEFSVDEAILNVWELVNKILQHQTLLESWMKGGFLNIAKARYVMGQHTVGVNQLPAGDLQVTAGRLVHRQPPADEQAAPPSPPADGQAAPPSPPAGFCLRPPPAGADGSAAPHTDPLRWFSALPPAPLRDAQTQFGRSLEICCELATMRAQLAAAVARLEAGHGRLAGLTEAVQALAVS